MAKKKSIRFSARIGLLTHLPGMRYLEIPKSVVAELGGKFRIRLVCKVTSGSKSLSFQGGLVALGGGKGYISITQKRLKELGVREGDRVALELQPDGSRYGLQMPAELRALLAQDTEGARRFERLTPGRRRYILHYVGAVKNSDLRLERAMLLIENLKTLPEGKESFREMLGLGKNAKF